MDSICKDENKFWYKIVPVWNVQSVDRYTIYSDHYFWL